MISCEEGHVGWGIKILSNLAKNFWKSENDGIILRNKLDRRAFHLTHALKSSVESYPL